VRIFGRIAAVCLLAALPLSAASAADLVVLSNQGAIPGVRALADAFAAKTGHNVTVIQATNEQLEAKTADGTADLITGNPENVQVYVDNGRVVADTVKPFVLAELGVSVQEGAPKPDISTVDAYVAALRAASSIGYSFGCSGTNVAAGIERLGMTEELAPKTTRTTNGPVTAYLQRREVELGIQQTNIMVGVPGTDFVGPVPGDLNVACQSDVGLIGASHNQEAARDLIEFMVSDEAGPILRTTHVEPYTR
jgi:molybdate transport system substrate-binding protein